jgi:hypothetical protein
LDDLKICENFSDLLAAIVDFLDNVLGQTEVNQAAGLEKVDDLGMIHGTGKDWER